MKGLMRAKTRSAAMMTSSTLHIMKHMLWYDRWRWYGWTRTTGMEDEDEPEKVCNTVAWWLAASGRFHPRGAAEWNGVGFEHQEKLADPFGLLLQSLPCWTWAAARRFCPPWVVPALWRSPKHLHVFAPQSAETAAAGALFKNALASGGILR